MKVNFLFLFMLALLYSCQDNDPSDLETLFFTCNDDGQEYDFEVYDGLVEECINVIYDEDFNSEADTWVRDESEYKRTVEGGKLLQESLNNTNWYFFNDAVISSDIKYYQIDFELDILTGSDDYYHTVTWGGINRLENYYVMGINGKNEFRVGTVQNKNDLEILFYLPVSVFIAPGANLLTIRVVNNKSYLFINKEFITSLDINPYGSEISFSVAANSSNTIDNVTISQYRVE